MKPTSVAVAVVLFLTMFAVPINGAVAQEDELPKLNFANQFGPSSGFGGLGNSASEITFSGEFKVKPDRRTGVLSITAEIAEGWHTYSVTQQKGGPTPSTLKLVAPETVKLTGAFKPDRAPKILPPDIFPVPSEEHEGKLVWSAPIELAEGINAQDVKIKVEYDGQVCENGVDGMPGVCKFITDEIVEAGYAGVLAAVSPSATEYRAARSHAKLTGRIEPNVVAPGDTFALVLTASMDPDWHVYELVTDDKNPDRISKPTIIALTKSNNWPASQPVASGKPIAHKTGLEAEPIQYFHEGQVSWTITLTVPKDAKAGAYEIGGAIGYQTCTLETCDLPLAAAFAGSVTVGEKKSDEPSALGFEKYVSYRNVESLAKTMEWNANAPDATSGDAPAQSKTDTFGMSLPFGLILLNAFAAGFILNFMPCVLPVIGLKIMSFAQQAGESKWRVFALNAWFSLGLLSVFWIVAAIVVGFTFVANTTLGWGAQFSDPAFAIPLAGIVFIFALSFLGVWEIPIPGFVGSGTVGELGNREGAAGAFAKGVLATILATPCTGPLLGPVIGWAVSSPAWMTFTGFTAIGFGMATPYLLIGAFPKLIGLLPKPGAWMESFKKLMGFVLLFTVVWILNGMRQVDIEAFNRSGDGYLIESLVLLVTLGISCWIVGMISINDPFMKRFSSWTTAILLVVLMSLFLFPPGRFATPTIAGIAGIWIAGLLIVKTFHDSRRSRRVLGWSSAAVVAICATGIVYLSLLSTDLPWQKFTRVGLDEFRAKGQTVLVDFTADW